MNRDLNDLLLETSEAAIEMIGRSVSDSDSLSEEQRRLVASALAKRRAELVGLFSAEDAKTVLKRIATILLIFLFECAVALGINNLSDRVDLVGRILETVAVVECRTESVAGPSERPISPQAHLAPPVAHPPSAGDAPPAEPSSQTPAEASRQRLVSHLEDAGSARRLDAGAYPAPPLSSQHTPDDKSKGYDNRSVQAIAEDLGVSLTYVPNRNRYFALDNEVDYFDESADVDYGVDLDASTSYDEDLGSRKSKRL